MNGWAVPLHSLLRFWPALLGVALLCSACAVPPRSDESSGLGNAAATTPVDPPEPVSVTAQVTSVAAPVDPVAPLVPTQVKRNGKAPKASVKARPGDLSFRRAVHYPDGVVVNVTRARPGIESGAGPGVVVGRPFLAMTVQVTNGSPQPLDLNQVVVTATYGTPPRMASSVYDDPAARDFSGTVAAGGVSSATYIFSIPLEQRKSSTVAVDFDSNHGVAIFAGGIK